MHRDTVNHSPDSPADDGERSDREAIRVRGNKLIESHHPPHPSPLPAGERSCLIKQLKTMAKPIHSDKPGAVHSDICPASVRVARRFFAPCATCRMVRLA